MINTFTSIDFETANSKRSSVCQVGIAVVVDGKVTEQISHLVNPDDSFNGMNIGIHGIHQEDVKYAPKFSELWTEIKQYFNGDVVAHNMDFDYSCLIQVLKRYKIKVPKFRRHCTYRMAKKYYNLENYKLPTLALQFNVNLSNHHEASSDALAAAQIFTAIQIDQNTNISKSNNREYSSEITKLNKEIKHITSLDGLLICCSGIFLNGAKKEITDALENVGAKISNSVTSKVDLLLLGGGGHASFQDDKIYGSKGKKALSLREKGKDIFVIMENVFFDKFDLI